MSPEIGTEASSFFDGYLTYNSKETFDWSDVLQGSITGNGPSPGDTDERFHQSDLWDAPDVPPLYSGTGTTPPEQPIHYHTPSSRLMESSSSNTDSGTRKKSCGACSVRRCKCDSRCVFAGVISYDEPHKYRALNELYNIKWVEKLLSGFPRCNVSREDVVEVLLAKDTWIKAWLARAFPSAYRTEIGGGTKRRSQPCGACTEKKCACKPSCVFAAAIPNEEPQKYRTLKKVFNITGLEKLLHPLNDDQRVEVVNLFLTEAERLIKEFSPGSGNHIGAYLHSPPPMTMAPTQDVLGPMDNLLAFSQQHENQLESWGGIFLS